MIDSGYGLTEDVLSAHECEALTLSISQQPTAPGRAGARHLMRHPEVARLTSDARLLQIAAIALGRPVLAYKATLFAKSGQANWLVTWHQDTILPLESQFADQDWGPWSIKDGIHYAHAPAWALNRIVALRVHLDASTGENGPLRVIPGSHRKGLLPTSEIAMLVREVQSVECQVRRGGVLAMRPLLIHASSKARSAEPRRVLHIEYADSLELKAGIRLAVA